MKPMLASSEELRTTWTHKLVALGTIIPRPNDPFNQSLDTTKHKPDIVPQRCVVAFQRESNTVAMRAETRDGIFNCALNWQLSLFTPKHLLRSLFNYLAGSYIDPLSLIVPVRRLIDIFKLWKRGAI